MQQSTLEAFETTEPDVPYEIPFPGSEGVARAKHRTWYWTQHDQEDYVCPDCDREIDEIRCFDVHHIDENPRNGDPDNLIALCRRCHGRRHGDVLNMSSLTVEEWKDEFQNILESEFRWNP